MSDDELFRLFCEVRFKTLLAFAEKLARGDRDDANDAVQKCLYDQRRDKATLRIETYGPNPDLIAWLRTDFHRSVVDANTPFVPFVPGYLWSAIRTKTIDRQRDRKKIDTRTKEVRSICTDPNKLPERESSDAAIAEETIASYRHALQVAFTNCSTLDESDRKAITVIEAIRDSDPATSDEKRKPDSAIFQEASEGLKWSVAKVKQRYYRALKKLENYMKSSGLQKLGDL